MLKIYLFNKNNSKKINIMFKTIEEINEKIKKGKAVVLTAEEVKQLANKTSAKEIAKKVDIVTTATFGAMCSSGIFINFGHSQPPIRMEDITINNVPIYSGLAAVDAYIGASSVATDNHKYGGGHIIEELIAGKKLILKAKAKGTDCYPKKNVKAEISKFNVNEMIMFNPRNAYQNYGVALNSSKKILHTYMGTLLPNMKNANYSTSGELSPLLNDPDFETIGIGTRIFLGGTQAYISWFGTQFNTNVKKNKFGIPLSNAATLAVIGDAKNMSTKFIKGAYIEGYGVTLFVGIGIPIPILNENIAKKVSIRNEQIETTVFDYSKIDKPPVAVVNYKQLQSGYISIKGKKIKTAPVSSLPIARQITHILKNSILKANFFLSKPLEKFPTTNGLNSLNEI